MTIEELCAMVNESGDHISLVREKGHRMPPRWPRGELMCAHDDGRRVFSYPKWKIEAWLLCNGLAKKSVTTGKLEPCNA